jgi:hypothetical protein
VGEKELETVTQGDIGDMPNAVLESPPSFKEGDAVIVGEATGKVAGMATYGQLWPEVIDAWKARKHPAKLPGPDPDEVILAVLLDGEDRPRNFRLGDLKRGQ